MIVDEGHPQKPFAVRELLPYWVGIEQWQDIERPGQKPRRPPRTRDKWSDAASTLRVALAHASKWLPEATLGAERDRRLSGSDVQGLRAFYRRDDTLPDFRGELPLCMSHHEQTGYPRFDSRMLCLALVELYLPWLEQDAILAQKVADAWNSVVQRGEADSVKCRCEACNSSYGLRVKCCCDQCVERERLRMRLSDSGDYYYPGWCCTCLATV